MRKASLGVAVALAITSAGPAVAQTIWSPVEHRASLRIEALHPRPDAGTGVDVSVLSGALFVAGAIPVGDRVRFMVELPFARSKIEFGGTTSSKSAVGNPYIGLQFGRVVSPLGFIGEFGVRPPLIGDDDFEAAFLGIAADLDRFEAFNSDVTTVSAAGNVYARNSQATSRFRLGLAQQFYSGAGNDAETLLDYGALGSVDVQRVRLAGGLTGRYILTESGNFSDRSFHHGAASASVAFGQIRPGVMIRVPFDKDIRDGVPNTIGLTLEYSFR